MRLLINYVGAGSGTVFLVLAQITMMVANNSDSLRNENHISGHPMRSTNTDAVKNHEQMLHNLTQNEKCTMAIEYRFDCARDKVVSQKECEDRGCCFAPLTDLTGPPWCYFPHLYPGYVMGPRTPSKKGQTAILKLSKPSYLPKDIPTLQLEVIEETVGCLHLTVSCSFTKQTSFLWCMTFSLTS